MENNENLSVKNGCHNRGIRKSPTGFYISRREIEHCWDDFPFFQPFDDVPTRDPEKDFFIDQILSMYEGD